MNPRPPRSLTNRGHKQASSPQEILSGLHAVVVDDEAKSALRDFLKNPPPKAAAEAERKRWNEQLRDIAARPPAIGFVF